MRTALLAAAVLIPVCAQAAHYTSETAFVNDIPGQYYMEHFPDYTLRMVPPSGSKTYDYGPVNGYSFRASCEGPSGPADLMLYADLHGLSTEDARDTLVVTFTGQPTYWVGGIFYACDAPGNTVADAVVNVTFSTGDTFSINGKAFVGLSSDTPIEWMKLDAPDIVPGDPWDGTYYWAGMDNVYAGATNVPEPATLGILPLVGLLLARRR